METVTRGESGLEPAYARQTIDGKERAVALVRGVQTAGAALAAAAVNDAREFSEVELQVTGLSGGDTIAVTRSIDGTNYVAVSWIDQAFATGPTISANGIYSFPGGGYIKWAQTGSASTPTVTLRAGN